MNSTPRPIKLGVGTPAVNFITLSVTDLTKTPELSPKIKKTRMTDRIDKKPSSTKSHRNFLTLSRTTILVLPLDDRVGRLAPHPDCKPYVSRTVSGNRAVAAQ